jgi:hypothetical protein
MRPDVTITADEIKASEIRPLVTVETAGLGVLTRERHRMY